MASTTALRHVALTSAGCDAVPCPCGCGAMVRPRQAAAQIVDCDTCRRGCNCPMESAGCEHYACWGAGSTLGPGADVDGRADTCPAFLAALSAVTA